MKKQAFTIREMLGFLQDKESPNYAHDLTTRALIATQYACDARISEITRFKPEVKEVFYQCKTCYTIHHSKKKPLNCRNCEGEEFKTKSRILYYKPIMPGIKWGAFKREYDEQGYIEIQVRNLKQNKATDDFRDEKTVFFPTEWKKEKKPNLMVQEQWNDLIKLETAVLSTLQEYKEEQARFKKDGPDDELFPFLKETAYKKMHRVIGQGTHILRGTRATHLSYRLSGREVQDQLGHKKADNTARYIHVFKEQIVSKF